MDWAYPLNNWMPKLGINPPFWFSEEYFQAAGWKIQNKDGFTQIIEERLDIFPRFTQKGIYSQEKPKEIWCGLGECPPNYFKKFLDYEYVYDPKQFLNLSGGQWTLFRKKINKFYAKYPEMRYTHEVDFSDLLSLVESWIENKKEETIEEGDIIIHYLANIPKKSKQIKGIYYQKELIGVNIWDKNWKYINFRYSFGNPKFEAVNYALRHLFYTDLLILNTGYFVNDGGTLNNPTLEFFKDHLNPVQKNKLYSWIRKN